MVPSMLHFYSVRWNTLPLLCTQASGQPQKQKKSVLWNVKEYSTKPG
jgi:hypothetical protein